MHQYCRVLCLTRCWCAGDKLPLGPPALMVSPQAHPNGTIPKDMVESRDKQMSVNTEEKKEARAPFREELKGKPRDACSDWWKHSGEYCTDATMTDGTVHMLVCADGNVSPTLILQGV